MIKKLAKSSQTGARDSLWRRNPFLRPGAALMTGSVVAQAVPVLLSPVLTRIYEPADFAAFALFTAVNAVLSVIAAARYDQAIMLPAEEKDAINVVALSVLILCGVCAVLGLLVSLSYGLPDSWIKELHGEWLNLLPLAVFATSFFHILSQWNNRGGHFTKLALSRGTQGTAGGTAQCGLGYASLHAHGLILGWLGGQVLGVLMLLRSNLDSLRGALQHVNRDRLKANAKVYRRFPLLSTWGALFDCGGSMMPLFIISHVFSATITGWFSFTVRVLAMPLFLISSAIAQVLHQRIARLNNEDPSQILPYILRCAAVLTLIAIPFVVILALFGVELFTLIFGDKWSEAGRYAGLLALAIGIQFIVSPLSVVLTLNHNLKACVQWQVLYFFTVTLTLTLGRNLSIDDFLVIYVIHELILYSLYFVVIIKAAGRRPTPTGLPDTLSNAG